MFGAGTVAAAESLLAMNFLLDRDADAWSRKLAALRAEVGDCDTGVPLTATGALSGKFEWRCAHGRVEGSLMLAPTRPALIQDWVIARVKP